MKCQLSKDYLDTMQAEEKRMDRLDAVIHEYLRSNHKTMVDLSERTGCSVSSLWRYSRKVECFRKAPLGVISQILRLANVSNVDLRYILSLPTGLSDEGRRN